MKLFQTYNKRIKAYVKFKQAKDGLPKIVDVKQHDPKKPFLGIRIK